MNVARLVTCLTTTRVPVMKLQLALCSLSISHIPVAILTISTLLKGDSVCIWSDCCYKTSHSFVKDSWNVVPSKEDKPFPQLHCKSLYRHCFLIKAKWGSLYTSVPAKQNFWLPWN